MEDLSKLNKLEDILASAGGLYSVQDILNAISSGKMQSFSNGSSMIVTSVENFPQKKILRIVAAVGTLQEIKDLEPRVIEFGDDNNCKTMLASGRSGWEKVMTSNWSKIYTTFIKELV